MTSIAATGAPAAPLNRPMILASVMLATILVSLDQTIANVALPHMAGSVSASQDQIAWVLTSYIVAGAICTPITGWLADRLGRRRLLITAVVGFIAASALCGAAQNLPEIVLFRAIQGIFGAPLIPMSQALVLDIYSAKERALAMSFWAVGVMVAPIVGPVLGGWLTDSLSWRWVFYINIPVGALCVLGILTFVPDTVRDPNRRLDLVGFGLLSVAIASLQLVFDRGQSQDWFSSLEILAEAAIAAIAFWFALVHSFTSKKPFLPLSIFTNRNFATAAVLGVMVGVTVLSVTALIPSMLQTLYGYPVLQAGILSAPRGLGSIASMLLVGRLIGRIDTRALLMFGMSVFAFAFYQLSTFTLDTSSNVIIENGLIQGFGMGFVFMPLNTMAFATIPQAKRGDATSFYTLMRNLGGSAGISIMLAMLVGLSAKSRADLVTPYSLDNTITNAQLPAPMSTTDPMGIAVLSGQVDLQATMMGYSQVFHIMFVVTLCLIPMVLFMRTPKEGVEHSEENIVME